MLLQEEINLAHGIYMSLPGVPKCLEGAGYLSMTYLSLREA